MKLDDNISNVILFIEDEMNMESFLEGIFTEEITDVEFEERVMEYTNMLIKEVSITLNIEFELAKDLYDEYLSKNILDIILG